MADSVKLIMKWDILPDRDQEYFEFVVREWVPATQRLGLRTIGAWFSVYATDSGEPRIMAEMLADDLEDIRSILKSRDWEDVHTRLLEFVENYSQKVVYTTGNFQL